MDNLENKIEDIGTKYNKLLAEVTGEMKYNNKIKKIFKTLNKLHKELTTQYTMLELDMPREEFLKLATVTGYIFMMQNLDYPKELMTGARKL